MQEGESFGARVVLPTTFGEDRTVVRHAAMPAQFAVVADSAEVDVVLVTREMLDHLTKPKLVLMEGATVG